MNQRIMDDKVSELRELRAKGYNPKNLKGKYNVCDMRAAGFSASSLWKAAFSAE